MPMPMPGMSSAPYETAVIWVALLLGAVGLATLAVRWLHARRRPPAGRE
ncbi:MAG TPA: hypothetical protein VMV23_11215 [Candidatus Nanopelagicaceae bacterium]|nr:hypothetical protein [Candidatus Nanopelagicaceae bacterium]